MRGKMRQSHCLKSGNSTTIPASSEASQVSKADRECKAAIRSEFVLQTPRASS